MEYVKKVYGYVTREIEGKLQLLVFQHPVPEAGIQIPKGTVEPGEDIKNAVIRETKEETGLGHFHVGHLLAEDYWENDDGVIHHRYFYHIHVPHAPDFWDYQPTGGGEEEGLTFHFFWMAEQNDVELCRGHGDYIHLIWS